MNAIQARANAEALRAKALALYAEAKEIRKGPTWWKRECAELLAKIDEAHTADPQSKLSALPWLYRPFEHDDWGFIRDVYGNIAAVARYGDHLVERSELDAFRAAGKDPTEANARMIVRAVNCHDELVSALRFILAFYEPGQRYLDTEAWKRAEAGGRAILAKADGDQP
jgi:hypothetical protein